MIQKEKPPTVATNTTVSCGRPVESINKLNHKITETGFQQSFPPKLYLGDFILLLVDSKEEKREKKKGKYLLSCSLNHHPHAHTTELLY